MTLFARDLSREDALALVAEENRPRYPNIKWYLDAVGMDFAQVIPAVNSIPSISSAYLGTPLQQFYRGPI
jgi:hypothetical protein